MSGKLRVRTFADIKYRIDGDPQSGAYDPADAVQLMPATEAQVAMLKDALGKVAFDAGPPLMAPLAGQHAAPHIGPGWYIMDYEPGDGSVYWVDRSGWVYRSDATGLSRIGAL